MLRFITKSRLSYFDVLWLGTVCAELAHLHLFAAFIVAIFGFVVSSVLEGIA